MSKRTELLIAVIGTLGCLAGIFLPSLPDDGSIVYLMQTTIKWTVIIMCGVLAVLYWLLLILELCLGNIEDK